MTDIGGTKTVYAPVTPLVDNNSKPSTGVAPGTVSPGLLQPGPNTTWIKVQVSEKAKAAGRSDVTIGASEARVAHGIKIESEKVKINNPTVVTEQEANVGGTSSGNGLGRGGQRVEQEIARRGNEA